MVFLLVDMKYFREQKKPANSTDRKAFFKTGELLLRKLIFIPRFPRLANGHLGFVGADVIILNLAKYWLLPLRMATAPKYANGWKRTITPADTRRSTTHFAPYWKARIIYC